VGDLLLWRLRLERRIASLPESTREVIDERQLALPSGSLDEDVARVVIDA
jgi:hypothetical protein